MGGRRRDREQRKKQPFMSLSVCAQQLQLCSINSEDEPLSVAVNACLYTQASSIYSQVITGHANSGGWAI